MMKLLIVMFSVISPFSVQPAAIPVAHDMQWTVIEEEKPEIVLAVDRSEPVQHFRTLNGISLDDSVDDILARRASRFIRRKILIWAVQNMNSMM